MTNYKELGYELGALLEEKQRAYGNVFSATPAIIGLLFPDGIPVLAYRDLLTIVRILDKIGRICTAAGKGDPMGEDPWRDIAGYAMLALGKLEEKQWQDDLETEAYLDDPGPEPSDTVDDEPEPEPEFTVRYGGERCESTFGIYDDLRSATNATFAVQAAHPGKWVTVENQFGATLLKLKPEPEPSNKWAVTWRGPGREFIDTVFETKEAAEARCKQQAEAVPGIAWRVCRFDEALREQGVAP